MMHKSLPNRGERGEARRETMATHDRKTADIIDEDEISRTLDEARGARPGAPATTCSKARARWRA
jgi:hypothetical protein